MMNCLFPGSFDPVTNGHMDIIQRASKMFDRVYVGVLINPDKKGAFSVQERVDMLKACCEKIPNVSVLSFQGLTVTLAQQKEIGVLLRGVRGSADFEGEMTLAHLNRKLDGHIETLFLPCQPEKAIISSSAVRQIASFGGDIASFVPECILKQVQHKFQPSAV